MKSHLPLSDGHLIPLEHPPGLPGWNHAAVNPWIDGRPLRHAAVLIAIRDNAEQSVIFTERQQHLADHAGQVAFPGGGREALDASILETALRESEEEIGLDRQWVNPIGYLDCLETISAFAVTPVVAQVRANAPQLVPNQAEVAEVFEVPLHFFLEPENLVAYTMAHHGHTRTMAEFRFQSHRIWGATAAIITNMLKRMGQTWIPHNL